MVHKAGTITLDTGMAFIETPTTPSPDRGMSWLEVADMQHVQPDIRTVVAQQIAEELRTHIDDLQLAIICTLLQEIQASLHEIAAIASEQILAAIGGPT